MEKVERDGKVAVLYSPGFGAGWSTWSRGEQEEWLIFAPELIEAVLAGDKEKAGKMAEAKIPGFYGGGNRDLSVHWVPKGAAFRIDEYDGSESIELLGDIDFFTA